MTYDYVSTGSHEIWPGRVHSFAHEPAWRLTEHPGEIHHKTVCYVLDNELECDLLDLPITLEDAKAYAVSKGDRIATREELLAKAGDTGIWPEFIEQWTPTL